MLLDQALKPPNLNRPEAAAALESDRIEPELGGVLVTLDVNVRRLLRIAGVEVKALRPRPQHRWHRSTLPDLGIAMICRLSRCPTSPLIGRLGSARYSTT